MISGCARSRSNSGLAATSSSSTPDVVDAEGAAQHTCTVAAEVCAISSGCDETDQLADGGESVGGCKQQREEHAEQPSQGLGQDKTPDEEWAAEWHSYGTSGSWSWDEGCLEHLQFHVVVARVSGSPLACRSISECL